MKNLKIIIADDNKNNAELIKRFIENNSNFTILDIATSSKEEIEMIDKYEPDLILTDIERKGEDVSGLDIILNSLTNEKKEKYILITASSKSEFLYKTNYEMPSNIVGYLKKPFSYDCLIDELEVFEKNFIIDENSWEDKYYKIPKVDLLGNLTVNEVSVLSRLNIEILNKIYTESEYDILKQKLCFFYNINEDTEEDRKFKKDVKDFNVTDEEYLKLIKKIDEIGEKYIYK